MSGRWRVGRSLGRTLYIAHGPEDSKQDTLVGMMDTAELAQLVCDAVNRHLEWINRAVP